MNRIIFVPQFPMNMRYSEWWFVEFERVFNKYYDEVIVLGKSIINNNKLLNDNNNNIFLPVNQSINFELLQINEYLNLDINYDNDTIFISDISFPGLFSNVLYHKKIKNAFAFCHATSLNNYDYFMNNRKSKWLVERGHFKLFKKIFVSTIYHKKKLGWNKYFDNIEIIGVPLPPYITYKNITKNKNIISVSRNNIQKINKKIENIVYKHFGEIKRDIFNDWNSYYKFISESKIMLITSKEETFGYSVVDSILNNCIPIAPNKFSFPELLHDDYLYNNVDELLYKISYYIDNFIDNTNLLNYDLCNNFYDNLINNMLN